MPEWKSVEESSSFWIQYLTSPYSSCIEIFQELLPSAPHIGSPGCKEQPELLLELYSWNPENLLFTPWCGGCHFASIMTLSLVKECQLKAKIHVATSMHPLYRALNWKQTAEQLGKFLWLSPEYLNSKNSLVGEKNIWTFTIFGSCNNLQYILKGIWIAGVKKE